MSPVSCAGALAAVKYLKDHQELRDKHQERARKLKHRLSVAGMPAMECTSTHIVPILVGEAVRCKAISDELLNEHCLLYTSPSPRDRQKSRMPSSA